MNHNDASTPDQDMREALYNDQAKGPAYKIQLPLERVTTLRGILSDLDPKWLIPGNPIFPPADTPKAFYEGIRLVLDRHPLARFAEVRASGTGLHLILWLRPAVELRSTAEQQYWDHIVRAVQRTLPVDPDMPGMTALTRPVGAINTKNGAVVEVLNAGTAIEPAAVQAFMSRLVQAPFREVACILLGEERVQPCPVCLGAGTRLDVLDRVGLCYGGCSKVTGDRLFERILMPRPSPSEKTKKVSDHG
jgi:hypothetical protein